MKFRISPLIALCVLVIGYGASRAETQTAAIETVDARAGIVPPGNVSALTSPTVTPMTPLLTPMLEVQGTDGVAQSDIDDIMNGIAVAQWMLSENYGGDIAEAELSNYVVHFDARGPNEGCCFAMDDGIYIDPHHRDWLFSGEGPWADADQIFHMHTGAHEYVHVWQHSLGCVSETKYPLPRWLIEGMADYTAWQSLVQAGYPTAKVLWERERELSQLAPLSTPLSYMEPRQNDVTGGTALADVAVDLLVKQTPNGLLALRQICESVAAGRAWQDAFPSVFGLTSQEFYAAFEAARRNPVVNVGISGTVMDEDSSPATGYSVWACAALDTVGTCHSVQVSLDGSYKIALSDGHYKVSVTPPNSNRNDLYSERNNLYYSSETPTGLTPYFSLFTAVTVNGSLVTGIDMQVTPLPVLGFEGRIVGAQGQPLVNRLLEACYNPPDDECNIHGKYASFDYSAPDGSFFLRLPEGEYYLSALCGEDYTWSYYNSDTNAPVEDVSKASRVVVTDNKVTPLDLHCP